MAKGTTETEILTKAIEAFRGATGVRLRAEQLRRAIVRGRDLEARRRLVIPDTDNVFAVEVKRWLNPHTVGLAVEQMKRLPGKALLVAEYVNPNMAERLKQMEVQFLDACGNAYVNAPPLLVYIKGHKPPGRTPAERPARAFLPAGLKMVFALLCKPDLAGAPYRTIAQAANVARGTVEWVLADLRRLDHLLELGKRGRKLIRKEQLLERWVAAYPLQLRPKLLLGRYAALDPRWWDHAQVRDFRAYWGAEVAAARLTGYLKPELATVYIRDLPGRFLAAHQLRTDPRGNVEVLEAFWNPAGDWTDAEVVHPLLVYADLLATGDPRNVDIAKQIYDDHLAGLVRED